MAGAKFDILFVGELMAEADPSRVRSNIQERFKLSDEAAARLFDGRAVTIKRGVDTATASHYRKLFRDAGALVRIASVAPAGAGEPAPESAAAVFGHAEGVPGHPAAGGSRLSLAPLGDDPLERPVAVAPRLIDVSHLSLVPGQDWTLADCEPPLPPCGLPDISHLRLVAPQQTQRDAAQEPY